MANCTTEFGQNTSFTNLHTNIRLYMKETFRQILSRKARFQAIHGAFDLVIR